MKSTNNEQPLVSVIMPTYNHGKFIGKAIDSVLNQTYSNIELIVIDNFSEDDTENIAASYTDNRIIYLKFKNNGIIAASRNHGIKHSHGEYIAFLDSDDLWHKQKLEKQLPHFRMPEIIGVASNAILDGEVPYYRKINSQESKRGYVDYKYRDILIHNRIATSSLIVRKETLVRSGLFDEKKAFSFIEDWELWLRMARYGLFRVLETPLFTYFVSRKRGYQSCIISKNRLIILEKQVDLGYVGYDDIVESKVYSYFAIARALWPFDQQQSREYYFKALEISSNITTKIKIKAWLGVLLTFLPSSLLPTGLQIYRTIRINLRTKVRSTRIFFKW